MNFFKLIYIVSFLIFCAHSKVTVFDEGSDFLTVSRTKAFVDKTLLIKTVFQAGRRLLITAPRKFGKSTNLNMLKTFLSLESKHNEEILQTFKNLTIYDNSSTFFADNFAKHPVLYVDFKSERINTYEEALHGCKLATHNAYIEHEYLMSSESLLDGDKKACKMWCEEHSLKQMGLQEVASGLVGLARMLRKHFNKEVVVLIDEYDSINNNALFTLESNSTFQAVVNLTSDIITKLLNDDNNVRIAVVTGVSYIWSTGLSDVDNLRPFRFLDDHSLVRFYGLTEEETDFIYLKEEFKSRSGRGDVARKACNGYVCKSGTQIYNTYSFLMFLETGKTVPHWKKCGYVSAVFNILRYSDIQIHILSLLNDGSLRVNPQVYDEVSISNVYHLKHIYSKSNETSSPNVDVLLPHLLELGYLTYSQTVNGSGHQTVVTTEVKIPNKDVYSILFTEFKNYFITKYTHLPRSLRAAGYSKFVQAIASEGLVKVLI